MRKNQLGIEILALSQTFGYALNALRQLFHPPPPSCIFFLVVVERTELGEDLM